VRRPVVVVTALAWVVLVLTDLGAATWMPHSVHMSGMTSPSGMITRSLSIAAWLTMLVAMMAPLVIAPIRHVHETSFVHRRARAIALFVVGYMVVWTAIGAPLIAIARAMASSLGGRLSVAPVTLSVIVAAVWQCAPVKQRCLNRCHAHSELAAFGLRADIDALHFSVTHALWCVGSCWALMLLSFAVMRGHLLVMATVTLWLLSERIEVPQVPSWRVRIPGRAMRALRGYVGALYQPRPEGSPGPSPALLEAMRNSAEEFPDADWLQQDGFVFPQHRTHREKLVTIPREVQHLDARIAVMEPPRQFVAAHARHYDVDHE
jgi:predicted metal-binding membrane protein